ncbi:MAG: hypothetical protein RL150_199 [Candidatus Parcubacteria bacterium]|jgi:MFS family permease
MQAAQPKLIGRNIVYLLTFLFTLHVTPATYIESSFLGQFVSTHVLGFIFSLASVVSIFAFIYVRPALRRFGNYKTFTFVILVELLTLLAMAFSTTGWMVLTAFIIGHTMRNLAFFHLDIFLEELSSDKDTGSIRGIYLTVMNISFIIGPIIGGMLLTNGDYWKVFMLSIILLAPVLYIMHLYLTNFRDPDYKDLKLTYTAKRVLRSTNLYSIFAINSLLRLFYAWMTIYTPLYLITHAGFSISQTMLIIGLALIAFVLLQGPLGYLADKVTGEKEFLIAGFLILGFATAFLSFLDSRSFWIWVIALFMTRVGASMVEVMAESYFFKKIDSEDLNVIGFFRMLRPFVYTLAPLLASLLLFIVHIKYLFLLLGIIMLYGVKYSLALKDTR